MRLKHASTWFFGCLSIWMTGCSQSPEVAVERAPQDVPVQTGPRLKVAVIPFGNLASDPAAGTAMTNLVAIELSNSGRFDVYTRQHLAALLAERDLQAAGILEPQTAMRVGKLCSVDALVCGVCLRYGGWSEQRPGYGTHTGPRLRNQAVVECQVALIDTATGRHIAQIQEPSIRTAQGSPYIRSPLVLLQAAEREQVSKIVDAMLRFRPEHAFAGDMASSAEPVQASELVGIAP